MSIKIEGSVSLDDVIPLINILTDIEQEELRQFLSAKPRINWEEEWEKIVAFFQRKFSQFPETEVIADLDNALNEVRNAKKAKGY